MSMQLARMLKQAGQQAPESKPVLEVNPEHALVKKLEGSVHFSVCGCGANACDFRKCFEQFGFHSIGCIFQMFL